MLLQVFNEALTDGPAHITVDGDVANPYVLAAVVLVGLALAVSTYAAVVLWTCKRALACVLLTAVVLATVGSVSMYHLVAFLLQSAIIRRLIPTTFLGAPSPFLAPLILLAAALLARLVVARAARESTRMPHQILL